MASNYFSEDNFTLSRAINALALAGVCGVLFMAFLWQVIYHELPCPLCLLQRVAFVLVGMGLLLNLRFGPSPLHYGMIVLSALGGAFASGRQVLLHIAPGDTGYGSPFLGMHFYTWALVLFVAFIVYSGAMLMLDRRCTDQSSPRPNKGLVSVIMWAFFVLVLGNLVSTLLECGFGACADDPVSYLWLS